MLSPRVLVSDIGENFGGVVVPGAAKSLFVVSSQKISRLIKNLHSFSKEVLYFLIAFGILRYFF